MLEFPAVHGVARARFFAESKQVLLWRAAGYNLLSKIMSVQKSHRPGETVPETGVYVAVHDAHRPTHEVILRKGDVFPNCAQCGNAVRFEAATGEAKAAGQT
jgi:hypothetical protein